MTTSVGFFLILAAVALYLRRLEDPIVAPPAEEHRHDQHLPVRPLDDLLSPPHRPLPQRSGDSSSKPPPAPAPTITPHNISRAQQTLALRRITVKRVKGAAASLTVTDPHTVIAWAIRRTPKSRIEYITTRELIQLAAQAAGETEGD